MAVTNDGGNRNVGDIETEEVWQHCHGSRARERIEGGPKNQRSEFFGEGLASNNRRFAARTLAKYPA